MTENNEQLETRPRVEQALVGQTPAARVATPQPVLQSSDEVAGIIEALCKAQSAFGVVAKDREANIASTRGSYKYGYATLSSVIAAVRPALNAQGIVLVQSANVINTERAVLLQVDTRFIHTTGQWLGSVLRLPLTDATPQGMGSLLSYLRRYGLSALAGVSASEEDDDGQAAQPTTTPVRPKPDRRTEPRPTPPTTGTDQSLAERQAQQEAPAAAQEPRPAAKAAAPKAQAPAAPKAPAVPLAGPGTITNRDRALLFKTAKTYAWTEQDVKALIKQRFGHDSTSQLSPEQLSTVLASIETPEDHGITFEDRDGVKTVVVA
jgi:hypothetical protein